VGRFDRLYRELGGVEDEQLGREEKHLYRWVLKNEDYVPPA
jgi:hypothetical protein